ncbi:hypothetical protein [Bacillus cereus]|uniref:hypothetical protein n=1 Tax=Bacillus cereus TaxID=1396 RepID=UPI000BF42866|nr:hypothetical protein [Bacillus cereus]PEX92588.1 hypothetical protein CN450_05525 [Bacillus cereus]
MGWEKFELEKEVKLLIDKLEPFYQLRAGMVDISTDLGKWRSDEEEAVKSAHNLIAKLEPYFQPNTIGLGVSWLTSRINGEKGFDKLFREVYECTDYEIVASTEHFLNKYYRDKILKSQYGDSYWDQA